MRALSLGRKLWVAGFMGGALVLTANALFASVYAGRIYPGVKLGGVSLGGLTIPQAVRLLKSQAQDYQLKIQIGNQQISLDPQRFGGSYDAGATAEQAYLIGRSRWLPILGLADARRQGQIKLAYSLDRRKFAAYVTGLAQQYSVKPVDARIVIANGKLNVEQDQSGRLVDRVELLNKLDESFAAFSTQTIVVTPTTAPAAVKVVDTADAVSQAHKIMALPILLHAFDRDFRPAPADIGNWIAFKSQGGAVRPYIDQARVKTYLQIVAEQVDISPVNKKIDLINGVAKVTQEGKEGTSINQDAAAKAIAAALEAGKGLEYSIPTVAVAYKTIKSEVISLEGGRYVEINIPLQHLWVWDNHQVIYESPLTSGAVGAGFYTPYGLFAIYYKTTDFWMDGYHLGYDYYVHVDYWMPFNRDVGMHDASWRNGQFGGQDYIYNGSHGCVNLPLDTAAFIYNWSTIGTPVWVHG